MIAVILTESTPQQALFGDPIWVIKDWKSQLRWISVFSPAREMWPELESNQRHEDFQSSALPTELSSHIT